jgi:hypothetical protein
VWNELQAHGQRERIYALVLQAQQQLRQELLALPADGSKSPGRPAKALTKLKARSAIIVAFEEGAKVAALGDAMFSLHHDAFPAIENNYYTDQFTWGFTAWNSAASVNSKCLAAQKPGEQWFCFHGAIAAQYVKTPLFVANSKHDTWQVRGVLGMNTTECPGHFDPTTGIITLCNITMGPTAVAEEQFWEDYGDEMVAASAKVPLQHSFFLTNCPTHCQTAGLLWAEPAFPGTRLDAAVLQWYPEAIANVQNATWKAPRWLARHGDGCKVSATATQSS